MTETGLSSGHGPVFSLATPTNVISYGITQDIQISVSAPAISSSALLASGRVTAMMLATGDFEAPGTWRFRRRDIDVGSRIETIAYGGIILPGSQKPQG